MKKEVAVVRKDRERDSSPIERLEETRACAVKNSAVRTEGDMKGVGWGRGSSRGLLGAEGE